MKKNIFIIIAVVFSTAFIVGSGIFVWQRKAGEKAKNEAVESAKQEMREQVDALQTQIEALQQEREEQKEVVQEEIESEPEYVPLVLTIETEESLPRANENTNYLATIDIFYTGDSLLKATFTNLPEDIAVSEGIINGFIEIKDQKGMIEISGKAKMAGIYEVSLNITSRDGKSVVNKDFNLIVESSDIGFEVIRHRPAPVGVAGEDYTIEFLIEGGVPPYSVSYFDVWKEYDFCSAFTQNIDGNLTTAGSGVKTEAGSCSFDIKVQDSQGKEVRFLYGFDVQ